MVQVLTSRIFAHNLGYKMHRERLYAIIINTTTCRWTGPSDMQTLIDGFARQRWGNQIQLGCVPNSSFVAMYLRPAVLQ